MQLYDHQCAFDTIDLDYLSADPQDGSECKIIFRIPLMQFEHLMNALEHFNLLFYENITNHHGGMTSSLEEHLLLSLNVLKICQRSM